MYLKSIRAFGFKSFADKTEIDINKGITIIVGPNGSGKSNVVDAVRWVLGEQSVKELRGSNSMSDVIFSGSSSRNPLNRATVSLNFDNSDHYLKSEFDEVEIKRVCYKTGENEYYINNNQVRLKDITELFIDSGAGKESFNVISQGKVKSIIDAKPEERRTIIEDAAGVLKYKKRKEETKRKLDKTSDNLEKIDLIINELETSINPLRDQAKVAKEYVTYKDELKEIEISLIAKDINEFHSESELLKTEIKTLTEKLENMTFSSKNNDTDIEKQKLELLKLEEKITKINNEVLELTESLSSLDAEKQMAKERQKYEVDDQKLQSNIINLKETELNHKKEVVVLKSDIEEIIQKKKIIDDNITNLEIDLKKLTINKNDLENKINTNRRLLMELNNKKEIIEDNINNDSKLPFAVKSVLNNPNLKGIHNILGKLINVPDEYATAIDIALGANSSVVVVDDENVAKNAISYLKNNKLGRVTFFPINIISARGIDFDTLSKIKASSDFIGIAADLVEFDNLYRGIIYNQLGNTIIVPNIDAMNRIGKLVNYRYRVISLDGELLHSGGSMTGGMIKNQSTIINQKYELEQLLRNINNTTSDLSIQTSKYNDIVNEYNLIQTNFNNKTKDQTVIDTLLVEKNRQLDEINNKLETVTNEIKGTKSIVNDTGLDYLNDILEKVNKIQTKKELLEHELTKYKNDKSDLNNEINEAELLIKKNNSEYNSMQNELHEKELKVSRLDVKLDNLLAILNEDYSLTFEAAYSEYKLEMEESIARSKVATLKSKIKALGEVNIGSISEFDRINERYTFLTKQRSDLQGGIDDLNTIILSLDETMKESFAVTFDKVNDEFNKVFNKVFKGGSGHLKLTNPDDILNTGVEIIAEPPGKKLQLLSLLSGGEMTLTAIALLFAILNTRPVPFCILDEAEAALDDANVDTFGKYIKEHSRDTQFIIITHKKKTMEYADTLYGITMQESGVSKMVSVKLDEEDLKNEKE